MARNNAFPKGGLHLREFKLTSDSPIEKANMPKRVRIPMAQHLGAPAKTLVTAGQEVVEGQLIGEASGFVSANVHASVSGKVISVEKGNTLTAKGVDIVTIETGGTIKNWYEKKEDTSRMKPEEIVQAIQTAGVVGLGGAAFPTHVKLSPPKDKKIDTLIINGAECEPYLTIDHRMMLEKTDEILEGVELLRRVLSPKRVVIGIEENKPDAIEIFQSRLEEKSGIEVLPLATRYPQGGEKQLIHAVTRREVPSRGLPLDIGVVVENMSTVAAIYEAVVYKKPLIERGITFTGEDVANRGNFKVRIGTPFSSLIEDHGKPEKPGPILAGGPMMGLEITDFDMPVVKGTSGLVFLKKRQDYLVANRPCIRCAKCLAVCPIRLQPTELAKLSDALAVEEAEKMGLLDCIECGCCSYVCPSAIPIVGLIRYGKEFWRRKQTKK